MQLKRINENNKKIFAFFNDLNFNTILYFYSRFFKNKIDLID